MNFIKTLSSLEKKTPDFLKKGETTAFRLWKVFAVVLGFCQNIALGINAFGQDKIAEGIFFTVGLNAVFVLLLIAVKYLRYFTTKYRWVYAIIAFAPMTALLHHLYHQAWVIA